MRFDLLLAVFSSGLWAPLALMAFGFVLAVGGGIFLWQRRRKTAPYRGEVETAPAIADEPAERPGDMAEEANPVVNAAPAAQSTQGGRRRRSLVGGAERDKGTPSGEAQDEAGEADGLEEEATTGEVNEPIEPIIEEAEFAELSDDDELSDIETIGSGGAATDELTQPAALGDEPQSYTDQDGADEETDAQLDPEWIEPAEEISDETEAEDMSLEAIAAAAGVTLTSAGAVAMAASDGEDEAQGDDELEPGEEDGHDNAEPIEPMSAEVKAALGRSIVFRQFLPQSPGKDGLSFYGGQPIGPSDFQWPRERGAQGGAPLQFVMQWDCAQLADVEPTGLLPQDGVLYCFINCNRGPDEDYLAAHTFIHHRGSGQAWQPIPTPEDAGPALGQMGAFELSGCTDKVENAEGFVPRVLPRFPFAPNGLTHPISEEDTAIFWTDKEAASGLLAVQKSGISVREQANGDGEDHQDQGRPFPAFPHDFGAVRVLSARMIEALATPDDFLAETLYPSLSKQERDEQFASWFEEAKEIYLLGTQRTCDQKLDQNLADDIWQWIEQRKGVLETQFPRLVEETVDLSLSSGSEALSSVPSNWIDKAMQRHALATECQICHGTENDHIRAATPARMFGPATYSDAINRLAHSHVLLLELPDGGGPGHHFGGKTLQYWITADDLAAGQFDAVIPVMVEASA